MTRAPWKTIRCIVEVPVQTNKYLSFTEVDLANAVERAMEADNFHADTKYLPIENRPHFGRVRTKSYNRSMAANKKALTSPD